MSGIDTSIYAALLRPAKSVADYDNEALTLQQNRLALQMAQSTMADKSRAVEDGNRLRQAVSGFGSDAKENYNALLKAGQLKAAQDYQKTNADAAESEAKASKSKVELIDAKLKQSREYLATVKTPEQYIAWHEANHKDPILGPELSARGVTAEQARASIMGAIQQPGGLEQLLQRSALGIEKFTEMNKPTLTTRDLGGTSQVLSTPGLGGAPTVLRSDAKSQSPDSVASNATSRANNASSNAVQMRGQNMIDARAKQATNAGKVPAGYRANADGTLSFIPGGPADPTSKENSKPPTEFQGKSAIFGARAEEADKLITGLNGQYSPAAINSKNAVEKTWLVGGALGAATNKMALSPQDQQAEQAQRDFINAVLRQESGAAIADSEFDNARRQYFPQPGDSQEVIQQKSRNRKLSVQGLRGNAGRAAFSAPEQEPVSKAAPPSKIPQGWSVTKVN